MIHRRSIRCATRPRASRRGRTPGFTSPVSATGLCRRRPPWRMARAPARQPGALGWISRRVGSERVGKVSRAVEGMSDIEPTRARANAFPLSTTRFS